MGTVSLRKLTAVFLAAMLAMCIGGVVFAQKAFAAADLSAGQASLTTQDTEEKNVATVKKFIKAVKALPAASKVKLADGKKVGKAARLYSDARFADEELSDLGDDYYDDLDDTPYDEYAMWGSYYRSLYKKYVNATKKYEQVRAKFDKITKKEQKKVGKKKVTGVKVVVGKKQATVSWKGLGKKYRYAVFYGNENVMGLEDGISKTKVTIKDGLKTGEKYVFYVVAYRPETCIDDEGEFGAQVKTKRSKIVTSKKVK